MFKLNAHGLSLYFGYELRDNGNQQITYQNDDYRPIQYSTNNNYKPNYSQKKSDSYVKPQYNSDGHISTNAAYKVYNDDGYKTLEDRYTKYGNKYFY